jgi:hypothetical protein
VETSFLRLAYDDGVLNSVQQVYSRIKDDEGLKTGTLSLFSFIPRTTSPHAEDPNPDAAEIKKILDNWVDNNFDGTYTIQNTSIAIVCGALNQQDGDNEEADDDGAAEEIVAGSGSGAGVNEATALATAAATNAAAPAPPTPVASGTRGGVGVGEAEGDEEEAAAAGDADEGGGRKQEEFVISEDPVIKTATVQRLTFKWFAGRFCATRQTQKRFFHEVLRYYMARYESDLESVKGLYVVNSLSELEKLACADLTESQWQRQVQFPFKVGLASGADMPAYIKNTLDRYKVPISKPHIFSQPFYYLTYWELQALEAVLKGTLPATMLLLLNFRSNLAD